MSQADDVPEAVPPGFTLMPAFGPFHELVGPVYAKPAGSAWVVGLRVAEKHRNRGSMMHGGMVAMLVDTAFTWVTKHTPKAEGATALTTQLSIDMMGNAVPGEWVEAAAEVVRAGSRVMFCHCVVWCRGERIAQASGQFQVVVPRPAQTRAADE